MSSPSSPTPNVRARAPLSPFTPMSLKTLPRAQDDIQTPSRSGNLATAFAGAAGSSRIRSPFSICGLTVCEKEAVQDCPKCNALLYCGIEVNNIELGVCNVQ